MNDVLRNLLREQNQYLPRIPSPTPPQANPPVSHDTLAAATTSSPVNAFTQRGEASSFNQGV